MNKRTSYKKILIVRLDRIGDVLLSTPVIKAMRDACPESHIAFMVQPHAVDIVKGNPYLDDVIVYDKDRAEKGVFGNSGFIEDLRKRKFDIALILHPTNRSHLVAFLAGIPERVGYNSRLGFLLTKRIPHTKQFGLKHESEYALDMVRYIGVEPRDKTLCMPLEDHREQTVKAFFERNRIKDGDMVVTIHPAASCPSKRWPAERFAETSDALSEKYGGRIVIISGLRHKDIADNVSSMMRRPNVNLAGLTAVGDIACILRRSKLFISNDSGPVHIACAVGTPVIAIFGRGDRGLSPARWGPLGKGGVVLHKDVGCDICLAHRCRIGFKCLQAITVGEVVAAAERILG